MCAKKEIKAMRKNKENKKTREDGDTINYARNDV